MTDPGEYLAKFPYTAILGLKPTAFLFFTTPSLHRLAHSTTAFQHLGSQNLSPPAALKLTQLWKSFLVEGNQIFL